MGEGNEMKIPTPLHGIACQELLKDDVSHCGWLRKKPSMRLFSWPQAYLVLKRGCLYYYRNEKSKSPSGKFSLYGYNSVYRANDILQKDAPWAFKIVHSHREFRTYYFAASSEKEMRIWMWKIKKEMLLSNGKDPNNVYGYVGGKEMKEDKDINEIAEEDGSLFYNTISTGIYEETSFKLPENYATDYGVKTVSDDSDDEMSQRPPLPLPPTRNSSRYKHPLPLPRVYDEKPEVPPKPAFFQREEQKSQTEEQQSQEALIARGVNLLGSELNQRLQASDCSLKSPKTQHRTRSKSPRRKEPEQNNNVNCTENNPSTEEYIQDEPERYWAGIYFSGSKQQAKDILGEISETGVYLVRPSEKNPDRQVLVVCPDDDPMSIPKQFNIQFEGESFHLCKDGPYCETVEHLMLHYYSEVLPKNNFSLTLPYKLHSKFPSIKLK